MKAQRKNKGCVLVEKSLKVKGLIVLIIAIIGLVIMLFKSGIVGLIVYLISAAISFISIPKENRNSISNIITYIKNTIRHISSKTLLTNDIYAIIIAFIPVMIVVGLLIFCYIDPIRAAERAVNDVINEIDNLF